MPVTAELDRSIMAALDGAQSEGLICQQIESVLKREHQSVSGNLRHLVEDGLVKATKLRGKTRSGRNAIKWVALRWFDPVVHGEGE